MKRALLFTICLTLVTYNYSVFATQVAAVGDIVRITTSENAALLCPNISCTQGQEILRLPTNTELVVESLLYQYLPNLEVVWYKITYKGKQGWVSEFDTDKRAQLDGALHLNKIFDLIDAGFDIASAAPAPAAAGDVGPIDSGYGDNGELLYEVGDGSGTSSYSVEKVFFATDRRFTGKDMPSEMFGVGRSTLTYGTCDVSIPRDHQLGELETPFALFFLSLPEDPEEHVVLLRVATNSKDSFFSGIADRVKESAGNNAFLFVHGYNVTFEEAARRTAQISHDLDFKGAPVFYSWPSQGTTSAYTIDEQNIEWAQANIKTFLDDFFMRSGAQNVYLIAHSMGSRALTGAITALLEDKPALRSRLKEIILAAPDIDADIFKRDIAPAFVRAGRPVTLYASSEDLALVASRKIHGAPRAGDSGQGLVVTTGIETIDATGTDTSILKHSYFAESHSVLSDIFYIIRDSQRADQRFGLRSIDTQAGRYWEFMK